MREKTYTIQQLRQELDRYHRELVASGNKRPSTISTYIQHPDRFISFLEGRYNPHSER